MRIQNWKLLLLALLFISLFTALGVWQLSRAAQKKVLLRTFAERTQHQPLNASKVRGGQDLRFYRIQLQGAFDNAHTVLLDNKIYQGKIGYQVYTPFFAQGMVLPVLVDRGFVPIGQGRKELPIIRPVLGQVTITGMLNVPPAYLALGKISESARVAWPLRIEYVNLAELAKFFNYPLSSYIINILPTDPAAYAMKWQIVTMGPERHLGYAVQWFALALTLLIISVAIKIKH